MNSSTLFAVFVVVASGLPGTSLAETNYYGVSSKVAASFAQNNADAGPITTDRTRNTTSFTAERSYGAAPHDTPSDGFNLSYDSESKVFTGTRFRDQDTADQGRVR